MAIDIIEFGIGTQLYYFNMYNLRGKVGNHYAVQ